MKPSPDPIKRQHPELLSDRGQVIDALARFHDGHPPRTGSLMSVGGGRRQSHEVFGYGFLSQIEEQAELERRLAALPARDRLLLLLWYTEGWPVTAIAEHLQISRVHCYRVRDRAIAHIISAVAEQGRVSAR